MAGSANTDAANRDAAMRRVAIVLSSLPASAAAKLLGTVDQNLKPSIRHAMATLQDVDSLERHRALQAFKMSVRRQPNSAPSIDELSQTHPSRYQDDAITPASQSAASPPTAVLKNRPSEAPPDSSSPLAFLADVEDDHLVGLLDGEHAQAVALVLASVAPAQAARVLPRLEPQLRSSALSRLGRLGEVPEAAAAEVADHFRARLSRQQSDPPAKSKGKCALDAILAAMPSETSPGNPTDVAPPQPAAAPSTSPQPVDTSDSRIRGLVSEWEESATDQALRLSILAGSGDDSHDDRSNDAPIVELPSDVSRSPAGRERPTEMTFTSTDEIHAHLINMSAKELCTALGRVPTREAMLTLCGLPNAKAEAVLSILPRDQARTVRTQMASLHSLNLRDIDRAKEHVASVSLTDQPQMSAAAA